MPLFLRLLMTPLEIAQSVIEDFEKKGELIPKKWTR